MRSPPLPRFIDKGGTMTAEWLAFLLFVFGLGFLAGALVWIPLTIKEQQRRFKQQMEFARRVREMTK